jgi:molybdenum cofactor cytidylyltransferase
LVILQKEQWLDSNAAHSDCAAQKHVRQTTMTARHFAVVPAAGHGVRLGGAKLLLPLYGRPLIAHILAAWQKSKVERIIVVVRPDDHSLAKVVQEAGAELVVPELPPTDMKASLQVALRHIEARCAPEATAAFLVAPADMPQLSTAIIDRLIECDRLNSPGRVLQPTLNGRPGHPVLFPWRLAAEVYALGHGEGLNAIVEQNQAVVVPCEDLVAKDEYPFADVDTPEEFERFSGS